MYLSYPILNSYDVEALQMDLFSAIFVIIGIVAWGLIMMVFALGITGIIMKAICYILPI